LFLKLIYREVVDNWQDLHGPEAHAYPWHMPCYLEVEFSRLKSDLWVVHKQNGHFGGKANEQFEKDICD
jgi:hypothetical protein